MRALVLIILALAVALASVATVGQVDAKHMKTLKCNENGACTAFCSTAQVSGAETIFCFTAKECHKFQRDNDGTPCKKQVIHD